MQIQQKLLKSLMARILGRKKHASHLVKMSRSKLKLSQITSLALIQEKSSNRIKVVHNKKNNSSRPHTAPAPRALFNQCLPEQLQGKPNLWKIMVKLVDDGKEPAAHIFTFQYKQFKIISVPKPSQTRQ